MEKILGLDVGDRTIGVAVSDALGFTAQGIETIFRKSKKEDYQRLEEIMKLHGIKTVVAGLPKNMNGSLGPQGEKTKVFCEKLKNKFGVTIIYWDERLSTKAAQRTLIEADVSRKKRKGVIDKMAAVHILQGYLDSL